MLPRIEHLRRVIEWNIGDKERQGYDVTGCAERLAATPASYDALLAFARSLTALPMRADWPFVEPTTWDEILAECDPERSNDPIAEVDPARRAAKVEAGFLGSVCGCVLGKPLEIDPTLPELCEALRSIGEWPIRDYVSERAEPALRSVLGRGFHPSWTESVRERIRFVTADDDLNYSILGLLVLERHGIGFTRRQLLNLWLEQLPVLLTFGPERMAMVRGAMASYFPADDPDFEEWTTVINPNEERCGALIRADPYGYACPGRPALAAELAWRDAGMTHRRTGVYGAMFVAALIACLLVMDDRMAAAHAALRYVPQRSRFRKIAADCLRFVETSGDWLEAYERIHTRYGKYRHCQIYQEVGTLLNTLRFARDVGDGICLQVMQGCDTDSFGCTAGGALGASFGPGHLEPRWLAPFNDDFRVALAQFHERSLAACARRMAALPARTAAQLAALGTTAAAASDGAARDVAVGL
jgi:hypothetical protein